MKKRHLTTALMAQSIALLLLLIISSFTFPKSGGSPDSPVSTMDTLPWVDQGRPDTPYVDWEALKEDLDRARKDILEDIDWDQIQKDMDEARLEIMETIYWEELMEELKNMHRDLKDHPEWEEFRMEMDSVSRELKEEIEWEEIKREMRKAARSMDSLFREMYLSPALPDSVR